MYISNFLSLSRIFLGVLAIGAMAKNSPEGYLVLFILGIMTDSLDGPIARRTGTTSKLGSFLDKFSDQFFEFFLALSLWLFATLPTYYFFVLALRTALSSYHLYLRHRPQEGQNLNEFEGKEVRLSSVLSLSVFFFYALALAGEHQAASLSRGLIEIALPYVLLPLGAMMEGMNLLKLFPQVFKIKK